MAIKGSLKEASLADVVQLLFLGRRTGCLSVASDRNFGSIWFDEGWITFAGMVIAGCTWYPLEVTNWPWLFSWNAPSREYAVVPSGSKT